MAIMTSVMFLKSCCCFFSNYRKYCIL